MIAVDARFYARGHGIGRYTRCLVDGLAEALNGDLVCLSPASIGLRWPARTLTFGLSHRILWANVAVPILLRRTGADVYHALDNLALPLAAPKGQMKFVLTVHDLIPLYFPRGVGLGHRWYFRLAIPRVLRRADAVVVSSAATASRIISRFPGAKGKIRAVPLGVDTQLFRSIKSPQVRTPLRASHGSRGEYILFVGTLQANKDVARLIRAFRTVVQEQTELLLVIAGRGRDHERLVLEVARCGLQANVIFTGYVPDADLPALYSGARAFVFPSLEEGFGLPPLEAMACGAPVVASDIPVFREVLGPAAVLVEPASEASLAAGILAVLRKPAFASDLAQLGQERVRAFPWERTIRAVLQVYKNVREG